MLVMSLRLFGTRQTTYPHKTVGGGLCRPPIGGNNVSEQKNHHSLYDNSQYPSRQRPSQDSGERRKRKKNSQTLRLLQKLKSIKLRKLKIQTMILKIQQKVLLKKKLTNLTIKLKRNLIKFLKDSRKKISLAYLLLIKILKLLKKSLYEMLKKCL